MSIVNDGVSSLLLCVGAIFFPPAVPLVLRGCGGTLILNILLTFCAWIPGVIHAFILVFSHTSGKDERKRVRKLQQQQQANYQDPAFVTAYPGQGPSFQPVPPHGHQQQFAEASSQPYSAPPLPQNITQPKY